MNYLAPFLSVYVLWVFYLAVMNLKRAKDAKTLTTPALVMGYPVLIIGYTLDIVVNLTVASVLFLEWPRETVLTSRLKRHCGKDDWRGKLAKWICVHLLDTFDPSGRHCS